MPKLDHFLTKARTGTHLLVGLTGGVASGKSTVARQMAACGAITIDFDLLAREIVEPGQPALAEIVAHFGSDVLNADGTLNRRRLSKLVFTHPQKRRELERITHPAIYTAFRAALGRCTAASRGGVVQAVVPLLVEVNLQSWFDHLIVVYVPRAQQLERLMARDGITAVEAEAILAAQLPLHKKLRHADFIVRNDGDREATRNQVAFIWRALTGKTPSATP